MRSTSLVLFVALAGLPLAAQPIVEVRLGSVTGPVVSHQSPPVNTPRDFGSRDVATGPTAPITLVVTNIGTGTLALSPLSMGGPWWTEFVIGSTGFQPQLTAGQSTSFNVAFDPYTTGQSDAYVRLGHTDGTQASPFYVSVTGMGTGSAAGPPVISFEYAGAPIASNPFSIGSLPILTQSSVTITIRNTGASDLLFQGPFFAQLVGYAGCTAAVGAQPSSPTPPGTTTALSVDVTPASQTSWFFFVRMDTNAGGLHFLMIEGVGHGVGTELRVVSQPANSVSGSVFTAAPLVAITDSTGAVDTTNSTTLVQVSITTGTGTAGAVLSGTTAITAASGYISFSDLEINVAGTGYSLTFTDAAGTLTGTTSFTFDVVPPPRAIVIGGSSGSGGDASISQGCTVGASGSLLQPAALLLVAVVLSVRPRWQAQRRRSPTLR